MNHAVELIWLAFALVFMGSFGLGWTVEEMVRKQHKRNIHVGEDD